MSFFRNPELFLHYSSGKKNITVTVVYSKFGTTIYEEERDYIGPVIFTHHLSLGDNKISDFDAFFAYLTRNDNKFVNCQGLVINYSSFVSKGEQSFEWVPRTLNTSFFGLPAHEDPRAKEKELAIKLEAYIKEGNQEKVEKQALENVVRNLETKNSTLRQTISGLDAKVCALEGEVERVKNEKNALIIDLDDTNIELLTLYKQTMLSLKAKSLTLGVKIERAKNEKNHICEEEEDPREAKELELQALKTELDV